MTVLGPVEADAIGTTLIHEHLLFDFRDYWTPPTAATDIHLSEQPLDIKLLGKVRFSPFLIKDNLMQGDVELVVEELRHFTALGGCTVVDPTNASLGRDPLALQQIARASNLNLIMGSGYYTEISLGEAFQKCTLDNLTDELVRDVTEGVDGTAVRAGLIGEIGTSAPITENELKSLRAAARAQAITGAPLMVHLDGWGREGHRVLDIVCEEGADITRTILCHMNPSWDDVEYQRSLAERGTYVEYDMMGMTYFYLPNKACPDDLSVLQSISHLICDGFLDRVLISQDVFLKSMFKGYGGLGYTHVLENLTPLYREVGMSAEHLSTIFRDNPRRLLCYLQEDSKL